MRISQITAIVTSISFKLRQIERIELTGLFILHRIGVLSMENYV